jgi:hypothetical protein
MENGFFASYWLVALSPAVYVSSVSTEGDRTFVIKFYFTLSTDLCLTNNFSDIL